MPTTFRDICPDVLLELCEYFSIDELYSLFYPDVLPHIFELLTASHKQLHLSMTNNHRLNTKLLSLININKIISIRLSSCEVLSNTFNTVKTLILHDVGNANSVISVPFVLPSLQRLVLIYSHHYNYLIESALKLAFARSSLKYLRLQSIDDTLPIPNNPVGKSLSIQQLCIDLPSSYTILMFFLNSLPNLRILRIKLLTDIQQMAAKNQNNVAALPIIHYPSLRTLHLILYRPTTAYITSLLIGFSNLKYCRISGVIDVQELNGNVWHDLITRKCSNLLRMNINMSVWIEIEPNEMKETFDEDTFFEQINFELKPSEKEEKLFIFFGNFQRSM